MFNRRKSFAMISVCWLLRYLLMQAVISQSRAFTWFEAQTKCREKNQSLTLWKKESTSFYWTGFYRKTSYWIKIIGCYSAKLIQNDNYKNFELVISSPPLCQERCFQENVFLFAVQATICICLSDALELSTNQLTPSNCTYTCDEGGLLSTECGGKSAFNVFHTDTTNLNVNSRCLSLQCGADPNFDDYDCKFYFPTICSQLVDDSTNRNWTISKEYCKATGSYPIGNLTLSNITKACIESSNRETAPRWIGVVKELHQKQDHGQLITNSDQMFIKNCMKCRFNDNIQGPQCQYTFCNDSLISAIYCTKDYLTTQQPGDSIGNYTETIQNSATSMSTSTESVITGDNESSVIQIVVPVVLVLLLLSSLIFAVVFYIRRKLSQEKDCKVDRNPSSNDSRMYSNVQPHDSDNYCEIQQPYSTSGSTDYSQLQFDSQLNYSYSNHLENGAEQSKNVGLYKHKLTNH